MNDAADPQCLNGADILNSSRQSCDDVTFVVTFGSRVNSVFWDGYPVHHCSRWFYAEERTYSEYTSVTYIMFEKSETNTAAAKTHSSACRTHEWMHNH